MMAQPDDRRRELAAIHVAKKALGLDDGTYRDMLFTLERVRSAADLDQGGRRRVLDHLRTRGFKRVVKAPAAVDQGKRPSFSAECQALGGKLEAQLLSKARPWNYARSMAKRMFKVDALEFCSADELRRLVAALEYDKRRHAGR